LKKKQLMSLVIMFVCVVALFAGYKIIGNYNQNKSEKEAAESEAESATIDIYDIDTAEVAKIAITNSKGTVTIVSKNDIWIDEATETPLNADSVQSMLDAIADFDAIKTIPAEEGEGFEEYGLDKPTLSYTITMNDGTEYNARFGIPLVTETKGHYALLDTDTMVYTVSDNYYKPFTLSLVELTEIGDEVDIAAEYITAFSVNVKEGMNFAAEYIGDELSEKDYYTWRITAPYDGIRADTDLLNAQLANYTSIKYKQCVAYNCEDLSEYGLEDPLATVKIDYYTVTGASDESETEDAAAAQATPVPMENREYSTFELAIGNGYTDDEGDSYVYVNPKGSVNVYTLSLDTVNLMINFAPIQLADACIYAELVDSLSGYDVEYDGKKYIVERKEENDENVYYVNGEKIEDTEGLLTLYSLAYLFVTTQEADDAEVIADADAVLTITYHENSGKDVVVKYLEYGNNNFYQVNNNGMDYFLTDKRAVDDLIVKYDKFMK